MHAGRATLGQRGGEGAALDDVTTEIDDAEQAGIAGKGAIGRDGTDRVAGEFALEKVSVHGGSPPQHRS